MILTVNGELVRVNRSTVIKWESDGRIFRGRIWGVPSFTPFGDLIIVHPFRAAHVDDWEQRIGEENVLDVDPWIRWHAYLPPIPNISWEEWKSYGN